MKSPLRIASIKKDTGTEARYIWENILKPKWTAKNKLKAERDLKKIKLVSIAILFFVSCSHPRYCTEGHRHVIKYTPFHDCSKYAIPCSHPKGILRASLSH